MDYWESPVGNGTMSALFAAERGTVQLLLMSDLSMIFLCATFNGQQADHRILPDTHENQTPTFAST